jgi:hypothetical protein
MKRLVSLVLSAVVLAALGCGSEKDKNVNKDRDKPKATDAKQKVD